MLEKGAVVKSLAGRDKGSLLAVVGTENGYCLVCDGKERPVDRPKRKNERHLEAVSVKLSDETCSRNRALRKELSALAQTDGVIQEVK